MGRQPCCDKVGLKRGPWTIDEDHKLTNFILNNGIHCWRAVPKLAGLLRCGKSCRLRWINYLRPDLKRGNFMEAEENQIIELHSRLGNRWSKIASHFPGRTDNEIKNYWNTRIKKKLKLLGLDPATNKPTVQQAENTTTNYDETINALKPNSSSTRKKEQEDGVVKNEGDDDNHHHQKQNDQLDVETSDLLRNYEILCGGLDFEALMVELESTNNTSSSTASYTTTSSLFIDQESNHNNTTIKGESSTTNQDDHDDDSLRHWFDSVDSFLLWND